MTIQDADKMLEWKNYSETRRFSISTPFEIEKDSHYKWLEENIKYFQMMEDNGNVCGAIRIKNDEISIWIDREFWNRGIATYVLQHISKRGMTARIVEGNVGSMRCFIRAGFEPISYTPEARDETSDGHFIIQAPAYYTFKKW